MPVSAAIFRAGVDDPLDSAAVHLTGGIWGIIATGLFASPDLLKFTVPSFNFQSYGLFYGGGWLQLGIQLLEVVSILAWTCASMLPLLMLLHYCRLLRVSREAELGGLDLFKHATFSTRSVKHYDEDGGSGDVREEEVEIEEENPIKRKLRSVLCRNDRSLPVASSASNSLGPENSDSFLFVSKSENKNIKDAGSSELAEAERSQSNSNKHKKQVYENSRSPPPPMFPHPYALYPMRREDEESYNRNPIAWVEKQESIERNRQNGGGDTSNAHVRRRHPQHRDANDNVSIGDDDDDDDVEDAREHLPWNEQRRFRDPYFDYPFHIYPPPPPPYYNFGPPYSPYQFPFPGPVRPQQPIQRQVSHHASESRLQSPHENPKQGHSTSSEEKPGQEASPSSPEDRRGAKSPSNKSSATTSSTAKTSLTHLKRKPIPSEFSRDV
jgi:hypothetical protein